ncbi:RNA polymerase factor sigma-54 [Hoylesella enoeca]|uniref:RNA polymerase sigma-54 factor n=1 Tax=Hoylesella enoeca TaxID=76123 RepID=A0A0S2KML2_9BACT|nr:RNA polymerase factor sigma-54 [Hoylesella enoeca]ALO49544.1 RNA polymerase sigma-54 factor [Hoylesella enoeca]
MAQRLVQMQTQKLAQQQRLSQQQMLQVRLLEMPLTELEESVNAELDDNPAMENGDADDALNDNREEQDEEREDESFDEKTEREERESALDEALGGIGRDDEMPQSSASYNDPNADYEEIVYGDITSFYDKLKEQMGEVNLTARQRDVMEYLIGSLDNDGLLRKDLDSICDELAIYHSLDVTQGEVEDVLHILQSFDPAGIGARNLQECLLLQIDRRPASTVRDLARRVIAECFDAFTKNHWDKIQAQLGLTDSQVTAVQNEIRRLNPKPGASLGETEGRNIQQITPDFIVDTNDDGTVSFSLNRGMIPDLKVSPAFSEMVDAYKNNKENLNREEKAAWLYAKEKMERAQGFIEAIKQRRRTLQVTMKAIIDWQLRFFQEGDEADLKPMILKDIADQTGLDISTISRVSNVKYAQTKWGTFPLRFFFSDGYTTDDGEEMSTRKIKIALRMLIERENKQRPMSDDLIKDALAEQGYPIARRTVAKYREQLGIPVARLRKQ